MFAHYAQVRNIPELRMVKNYHDHDCYISALAGTVLAHGSAPARGTTLIFVR